MRVTGTSGGAFYIRALANAVFLSDSVFGYKAGAYIGTSSGAIISFVASVLGVKKMWAAAQSINPLEAISGSPFDTDGNVTIWAKARAVFGGFPVKQSVTPILQKIVTKGDFEAWKRRSGAAKCFITTANLDKGKRCIINLAECSYSDAFLWIEASCAMQKIVKPVLCPDDCYHWDGGQYDHNPTHCIFEKLEVSQVLSVNSRPEHWEPKERNMKGVGLFGCIGRDEELGSVEKANNDRLQLLDNCRKSGINPIEVFIERVLKHPYDASDEGQEMAVKAAEIGVAAAFKKHEQNT